MSDVASDSRAVTNSTCLVGLERIGQLDILPQVFPVVFASVAVEAEVGTTPSWLRIQAVGNPAVASSLKAQLDYGEAETIALAMELGDVWTILDEKKARQVARGIGLKLIGTAGMLVRAKKKGVISEVKPILMDLRAAEFRISDAIVEKALDLAGE